MHKQNVYCRMNVVYSKLLFTKALARLVINIVIYRVMSLLCLLYIRLQNSRKDIHICFIFLDVVKLEML